MISLRSYIGTPHTIENIITVARPTIDAAANALLSSNLPCPLVGVTLDCVYGESKVELVRDLEAKNYIIGGATSASELVGGALREEDIEGRTSLSEAEVATQLMTVEPILCWSFSKTRTRSHAWPFGRGICPICAAEVSRVRAG